MKLDTRAQGVILRRDGAVLNLRGLDTRGRWIAHVADQAGKVIEPAEVVVLEDVPEWVRRLGVG